MATHDDNKSLIKSGLQRYADSVRLLGRHSHRAHLHARGAMYLAGYGVECLLKAYLIQQQSCRSLLQAEEKISELRKRNGGQSIKRIASSSSGHNIDYILTMTDIAALGGFDHNLWGRVSKWATNWRYDPVPMPHEKSLRFLTDVDKVMKFLQSKM